MTNIELFTEWKKRLKIAMICFWTFVGTPVGMVFQIMALITLFKMKKAEIPTTSWDFGQTFFGIFWLGAILNFDLIRICDREIYVLTDSKDKEESAEKESINKGEESNISDNSNEVDKKD